jgi:hypothetical protein
VAGFGKHEAWLAPSHSELSGEQRGVIGPIVNLAVKGL